MAGIDKIIKQIEDNTTQICDEIISEARRKADLIVDQAKAQADKIAADNDERVELAVKDIEARGKSSAALEERKIALQTKQRIISDMIDIAKQKLLSLSDDAYFDLILKMIEKNAQDGEGIICFNTRDFGRLPQGFEQKINTVVSGTLKIDPEPIRIDAGFVLKYGGIEENCSFDAVFTSEYEQITDRASRLLF